MFMKSFLFTHCNFNLQFASVMTDYLSFYKHYIDTVGSKVDKLAVFLGYGLKDTINKLLCVLKVTFVHLHFIWTNDLTVIGKRIILRKQVGKYWRKKKLIKKNTTKLNESSKLVKIMTQTFHTT